MKVFRILLISYFLVQFLTGFSQGKSVKSFCQLSCPEKWWVMGHPFVAKRALKMSKEARLKTNWVKQNKLLKGEGNGDQVDAFRHTYWMALLTQNIGAKKAKRLGIAHEKGNKKQFKKGKKEDGELPDKIGSDMDLFNNQVGIEIGSSENTDLVMVIIATVKNGKCKMIRKNQGNYIDCNGKVIEKESLYGKWENNKCLVWSDE